MSDALIITIIIACTILIVLSIYLYANYQTELYEARRREREATFNRILQVAELVANTYSQEITRLCRSQLTVTSSTRPSLQEPPTNYREPSPEDLPGMSPSDSRQETANNSSHRT